MDRIILPTLVLATRDLARHEISPDDAAFVETWSRDVFDHLAKSASPRAAEARGPALGIAAHGSGSELVLEMLAATAGALEILPAASGLAEVMARVERLAPAVVCVAALPPEGGPYAWRLCHHLKARFPVLPVVVLRPDEPGLDPAPAALRLRKAGADAVVGTLVEAGAELSRRLVPTPAAA